MSSKGSSPSARRSVPAPLPCSPSDRVPDARRAHRVARRRLLPLRRGDPHAAAVVRSILLLAAVALMPLPAGAKDLIVGVLEHPQCEEGDALAVRALFCKQGQQWTALSSSETSHGISLADVSWTVAFDGKRLGSIATVDPGFSSPDAWTYARDRLLALAPEQPVPSVANREQLFDGWCDVPAHRPLVVVSQPNFRDPEGWKRFEPDARLRGVLFSRFSALAGKADTCESE